MRQAITQLAPDFAAKLLDAELELENNCCLPVLQGLLDLYQEAVEVYERNDDMRYLDFQQRIHSVLLRPEVLAVLSAPKGIVRQEQSKTEKLKDKKAKLDKFKKSKTALLLPPPQPTTEPQQSKEHEIVAEKAFTVVSVKATETIQKTREGVKQQASQLEQRRQARRNKQRSIDWTSQTPIFEDPLEQVETISPEKTQKINSGNSTRRNSITSLNVEFAKAAAVESDKSGGPMRLPAAIENFQQELEELMEQAFSEKAAKLTEVKLRFEAEIKKTAADAGDTGLAEMLVAHIRKLMDEELASTAAEYDAKRKQEIRALKAKLT